MRIYETFVDTLYYQREETYIVGSFNKGNMEIESCDKKEKNKDSNPKNMKKSKMETSVFFKWYQKFLANHGKVSTTKKKRCSTNDVVHLSDEDWISIELLTNIILKTISLKNIFRFSELFCPFFVNNRIEMQEC